MNSHHSSPSGNKGVLVGVWGFIAAAALAAASQLLQSAFQGVLPSANTLSCAFAAPFERGGSRDSFNVLVLVPDGLGGQEFADALRAVLREKNLAMVNTCLTANVGDQPGDDEAAVTRASWIGRQMGADYIIFGQMLEPKKARLWYTMRNPTGGEASHYRTYALADLNSIADSEIPLNVYSPVTQSVIITAEQQGYSYLTYGNKLRDLSARLNNQSIESEALYALAAAAVEKKDKNLASNLRIEIEVHLETLMRDTFYNHDEIYWMLDAYIDAARIEGKCDTLKASLVQLNDDVRSWKSESSIDPADDKGGIALLQNSADRAMAEVCHDKASQFRAYLAACHNVVGQLNTTDQMGALTWRPWWDFRQANRHQPMYIEDLADFRYMRSVGLDGASLIRKNCPAKNWGGPRI